MACAALPAPLPAAGEAASSPQHAGERQHSTRGAARAVTRQPTREATLRGRVSPAAWALSPAPGGWSRLAPWQERDHSQPSVASVSRGSGRPYNEILLARGCCGSASTRAEGEGRILLAIRPGRRQARQKQSPGRAPSRRARGELCKHPHWAPERATSRFSWSVGSAG